MGRPPSTRMCAVDGCDLKHFAKGFCQKHYKSNYLFRRKTHDVGAAEVLVDDIFMACPERFEDVVERAVALDAEAILRVIWPHLLEAQLAGVQPFTTDVA